MATKLELKKLLFDTYGGFADKRLKKLDRDAPFIIDDRNKSDNDAKGTLFLWFCTILASVEGDDIVRLRLSGGLPQSGRVSQWYMNHGGREWSDHLSHNAEFDVTPKNIDELRELASRFSEITQRKYSVPAYKYVVPRTAQSLLRLNGVLSTMWN